MAPAFVSSRVPAVPVDRVWNTCAGRRDECNVRSVQDLVARMEACRSELTRAERLVAEAVLRDPEAVAFGTVAALAERAGTSGASVVRLATRLGYEGFAELQAAVREAIGRQLRPAAEKIRQEPASDPLARALAIEVANVHATLEDADADMVQRAVELLGDPARTVAVLAGDAEHGIGSMLASALGMLRAGVAQVAGSDTAVARELALLEPGDVVVALDLRRYERWVLAHARRCAAVGAEVIAITDSVLSPLAEVATVRFAVAAEGVGPFDSHVGMLALANALVAGVAARRRKAATRRLDRIEDAWRATGALAE
jgi:DNA-binding MurR/RpiR family transcriptional regulator